MNRFIIEETPRECALSHCDKHIVKMPTEEAQMLSTVHRILDGTETRRPSASGKTMAKYWELEDDREGVLYKAVHYKHPCTLWAMETLGKLSVGICSVRGTVRGILVSLQQRACCLHSPCRNSQVCA